MGRKNRIFKGNLKASQILAVLMLIVMIIRPIMEVSAKPGEITTENPSAEVGKEGESLSDGIDGSALYPLEENGQNGQMSENDAVRQNGQTSDETDAKNSPNASDRTVSEGSSEEENMTSAQQESLCNDEYCSHIYYDLDGRQHALCALGERMTETDVYRTAEDSAVYEAMYFASIPNLYEASAFGGATTFEKLHVNTVYALFYKEDPIEPGNAGKKEIPKTYRMISVDEAGLFGTVIPEGCSYVAFEMEVTNKNGEAREIDSQIVYNLRQAANPNDPYHEIKKEPVIDAAGEVKQRGSGSFVFTQKTRDCFYWDMSYHTSYWGGHPSSSNNILDELAIYVDNDKDGNYDTKTDKVWDELWVSYADKNGKIVSKKVTRETRYELCTYYAFGKGSGLTELSLLAISNGELNEKGGFKHPSDNKEDDKVYYQLYNIASGDNFFILRNLDDSHRIWRSYETDGDRYVAFKDQMYGTSGALVASGVEGGKTEAADTVEYRLCENPEDGQAVETEWKKMDQALPESSGTGQASEDMENEVFYKTFFTHEKLSDKEKYIQFRICENRADGKVVKYKTDITEIDDTYAFPCFFADVLQKKSLSYTSEQSKINGTWSSIFKASDHGDEGKNIPIAKNKSYDPKYYYANTTFYDYYSDYELQGKRLSEVNGSPYEYETSFGILNDGISKYFQGKNEKAAAWYYGKYIRHPAVTDGDNPLNNSSPGNMSGNQIGPNDWHSGNTLKYAYGHVDKQLEDGKISTAGVKLPQFDESFLRGNNAFHSALGYVYNNVSFPFFLADDGYWEYSSLKSDHVLRLKEDPDKGYYLDEGEKEDALKTGDRDVAMGKDQFGFFPFNDKNDATKENSFYRLDRMKTNFCFGMKMELEFKLTEDGKVRMPGEKAGEYIEKPIEFEFSGDDDFLLYIDGKLVLDMAGKHNPLEGHINFETGAVDVYGLNKDGATEDGYPINKNQHHAQANIYEKNDANGPCLDMEELSQGIHKITIFYAERGAGVSNLKIRFNFPKTNQLDLTNQVSTASANQDVFGKALGYIGSFTYKILNQATSGRQIPVEDSVGYLRNEGAVKFNDFKNSGTYRGSKTGESELKEADPDAETDGPIIGERSDVIKLVNKDSGKNLDQYQMSEEIASGKYWTTIDCAENGGSVDLSKAAYLQMSVYNNSDASSATGWSLKARLTDRHGNVITRPASQMTYYGYSNSMPKGQWSIVRLNLADWNSGISDFDMKNVAKVQFAFARDRGSLYMADMDFKGKIIPNQSTGFYASDDQISDYESLGTKERPLSYNEAVLNPVSGAFFRLNPIQETDVVNNGNDLMVRSRGLLELTDGNKASFVDKFREGSYLQITQDDPLRNKVFRTSWSILENAVYDGASGMYTEGYIADNILALHPTARTVENDPEILNNTVTDVRTYTASDDRNVKSADGKGYHYPSSNREGHVSEKNETFVFRSYLDPDNLQKNGIHLTVAYKNDLISGGLIITKTVDQIDPKKDHTYKFHVHYTDVAGMSLEGNLGSGSMSESGSSIVQEIDVTVPAGKQTASVAVYGIPKETVYTIHEENEIPQNIEIGGNYTYPQNVAKNFVQTDPDRGGVRTGDEYDHKVKVGTKKYNVNGTEVEYKTAEGTMKESVQEVTFANKQVPAHGEIKITKKLQGKAYGEERGYLFHIHYKTTDENNKEKVVVVPQTVVVKAGELTGSTVYENIPLGAQYEVHEVDETALLTLEADAGSTVLGSDDPLSDTEQNHSHTDVKAEKKHISIIPEEEGAIGSECAKKGFWTAQGGTGESRHNFTFTNIGSHNVAVLKTDSSRNVPLENAGFTLYDTEDNIVQNRTAVYMWQNEISISDPNYDSSSGRYHRGDTSYTVYTLKGDPAEKNVYYVPLTNEEIAAYKKGMEDPESAEGMDAQNREKVRAAACFENLAAGEYVLKETTPPNGYGASDPIRFKLSIQEGEENQFVLPYGVSLESPLSNKENVTLQVRNEKNSGVVSFTKENRKGEPLKNAKFALYRLICSDPSHGGKHDKDLIRHDENGSLDAGYAYKDCWKLQGTAVSDENGTVEFLNLPAEEGTEYRLAELKAPSGYVTAKGQWKVTYEKETHELKITGSVKRPPAFSGEGTDENPYKVINYTYAEFPLSGGRGYSYLAGTVLIAAAAGLWFWYDSRKRKTVRSRGMRKRGYK